MNLTAESPLFRGAPAWSPDGSRLAVDKTERNGVRILLMRPDGTHRRRLSDLIGINAQPVWSASGSNIAETACGGELECPTGYRIVIVSAEDGSVVHEIDEFSLKMDTAPTYSPDGTQIAFERCCFHGTSELFVWREATDGVVRLTHNDVNDSAPSWSPDGATIVFQRGGDTSGPYPFLPTVRSGPGAIWAMDLATGGTASLTRGEDDFDPDISPDGRRIVFGRCLRGFGERRCDLFTMASDGSDLRRVTYSRHQIEVDPAWQPVPS